MLRFLILWNLRHHCRKWKRSVLVVEIWNGQQWLGSRNKLVWLVMDAENWAPGAMNPPAILVKAAGG